MKVLIVDDHPVLREGLAALLRQIGPDAVILQAHDALSALEVLDLHADLDVVLLDLVMPGMDGIAAIAKFGLRRPEVPVVVLSSSEDPRHARQALDQGALGYVPKSASPTTLLSAIRLVLAGDLYIPPLILESLPPGATRAVSAPEGAAAPLTHRQLEVLRLLSEGRSNKAIAQALELSEKTVKVHITAIFKTLGVVNRTQAAAASRASGLV